MAKLTPRDTLDAARILVEKRYPYFRAAIYKIRPWERKGLGTMAMDAKGRMLWDPETVVAWGAAQTAPVFFHELCHFLRDHARRMKAISAPAMVGNIGTDAEINDPQVFNGDFTLPGDPVMAHKFGFPENLTAEDYVAMLKRQQDEKPKEPKGDDKSKDEGEEEEEGEGPDEESIEDDNAAGDSEEGDGSDDQDEESKDSGDADGEGKSEEDAEEATGKGKGKSKADDSDDAEGSSGGDSEDPMTNPDKRPAPGAGHCGGCANNPYPEEKEMEDKEEGAPPPLSESEQEITRAKVAQDIIQASQSRSDVPGSWTKWAVETLKPVRVPWQRVLAKMVRASLTRAAGQVDFTYSKLGRSYAARRHVCGSKTPISPGMVRPTPEGAVVIDRSGSMGGGKGSASEIATSEVRGVVRSLGCPVTAYCVDTKVGEAKRVFSDHEIKALPSSGGGTDMRVGIKAADEGKPRPNVIILLTDGYTPWPEKCSMPKADLIAVVIGDEGGDPPDYIKNVVRVPVDDLKAVTVA